MPQLNLSGTETQLNLTPSELAIVEAALEDTKKKNDKSIAKGFDRKSSEAAALAKRETIAAIYAKIDEKFESGEVA